jgi:hypothetical protein
MMAAMAARIVFRHVDPEGPKARRDFRGAADAGGIGIPLMTSGHVRCCWDLQLTDDV